ncbi:2-oxoacid:acceptor oxidoreductase family protein [Thermoflexus sp.]|uniref:2-oxoacid:acceptor oxidoreductase family protein n=1 Tax=Thermoflexus sp. TaxID=1969742 RepID=UPI0035E4368C
MRKEIRIAGFGGQGVVLAGYILGKAFAVYEGLEAVMTQSYGPEARGGSSSSNVVVSDEIIDYPFVIEPDILVLLSQEAYTRFRSTAKPDALVIIEEDLVQPWPEDRPLRIPATRLAEALGRRIVANMVVLGFLTAVSGLVKRESMEKAIETTLPSRLVPLNLKAFATGYEYRVRESVR